MHKDTFGFIAFFFRRYRARTLLLVGLLVLSGFAEGLGVATLLPLLEMTVGGDGPPSEMSRMVTSVFRSVGLTPRIEVLLVFIVASMFVKATFRLLAMQQVGYTVSRVSTDLRLQLIRALLRSRWEYFVSQRGGRFANAVGMEANRTAQAYRGLTAMFAAIVQAVLYGVTALLVSWKVAVLAIVSGVVVAAALNGLVRTSRRAAQHQTTLMKSLTIRLMEALQGIKPIKAMAREEHFQPLLEGETRGVNRAQERQVRAAEALKAMQEPAMVALMAVVLYFALQLSGLTFSAVLVLAFLFQRLAGRIGEIQLQYQTVVVGESAFWSLRESIDGAIAQEEALGRGVAPPPIERGIELRDVTFAFGSKVVVDHVSITVPAGQLVALVGPSGGGKTTIADLLVGLNQPRQGEILVDGVPLATIDLLAWRSMIGYVPQEMFLLHTSVYHNVALGDEAITRADVQAALEAAGAWDFVAQLPEGLDTVLGERGARVSGGQRQRIAIARALARKPRLLILDEVTTALDPRTEASICQTLRGLRGSMTILSVSHQPAMMAVADLVYRVEGGHVTVVTEAPSEPVPA